MIKRAILAAFFALASSGANAACNPANAPANSIGCQPAMPSNLQATDLVLGWRPSLGAAASRSFTPSQMLEAGLPGAFSSLSATGSFTLGGALSVGTNLSVGGSAVVLGNTTLGSTATVGSTLGVLGNFSVATNKFIILSASGNTVTEGTFDAAGTITGAGSIIAGNGGTAPITLQSGIISMPASQSLNVRLATAGQTVTIGAPSAGLGNVLTVTPNSNGNSLFGASPSDVLVSNRLTFATARSSGTTTALSGTVTPTAFSGTGATATVTFAAISGIVIPVGSTVTVSGATPAGYNGTFTVTASTNTTVSFASSATGALSVAGAMAYNMAAPRILSLASNWSGTPASGTQFYPYTMTIPSDTADTGATGSGAPLMYLAHNWGGAAKGSKGGLRIALTHTSATNDPFTGSINQQHVVGEWWGATAYNAGGTGSGTLAAGSFYGMNPQILLQQGATYWRLANAMGEANLAVYASSQTLTIGGTPAAGDTVTVTFTSADISGSPLSVVWTVGASQTTAMVANSVASLIWSNTALQNAKVSASVSGSVVTLLWYTHIASLTVTTGKTGTVTSALGSVTGGASVDIKVMGSFIRLAEDSAPGSLNSAFLLLSAQPGSGTAGLFNNGILFGGMTGYNGEWSWHKGSTLIGANPANGYGGAGLTHPLVPTWSQYGLDFSKVAFSGNGGASIRVPGFQVASDTTGAVYVGGAKIAGTSAGLSIDSQTGATATSVALASGGGGGAGVATGNYFVGDVGHDALGGQYRVDTVNTSTGAVATFTTLNYPSYQSGAAPSNPQAVSFGSGVGWTVNITWPATSIVALQPTGGTVTFGGDVKLTSQSGGIYVGGAPVLRFPSQSLYTATLVGTNAGLNVNAAAIELTAVGHYAGGSGGNTGDGLGGGTGMTGPQNTAIGWFSQTQMTTGQFNTSIGNNSMGHEYDGSHNVAVGTDSQRNSIHSSSNISIGVNSLYSPQSTFFTIAIGTNALRGQTTSSGSSNIAIGYQAMASTARTTAQNNVVMGGDIGDTTVTTGSSNTLLGYRAGRAFSTGGNNVAVGSLAGVLLDTGAGHTILGQNAGSKLTAGSNNVIIGQSVASTTLATGSNNILIGTSSAADTASSSTSSTFWIGGGSTAVISATNIAGTPAVAIPGSLALGAGSLTVSAGSVGLTKISASGAAAGAAGGKIELVCGTNSGTAKLIAYAGTSTTAVTILDNIGTGVTGC